MIYICIPVFGRLELTFECIQSIKTQTYSNFEIIVCEHSNDYKIYNALQKKFPEIHLLKGDESMWWTAATNKCIDYALEYSKNDDFIFTLNNDTVLKKNCLEILYSQSKEKKNSIVGCVNLLYDQRDKIEPSAQIKKQILGFEYYRNANDFKDDLSKFSGLRKVDTLSGKGVLIPVEIFQNIGLYNAENLPHYHADTEFIYRASKKGYQIYLSYSAILYSHHNETGITSRNDKTNIIQFIKGFSDIGSTRHIRSLSNRYKLTYGKLYPFYLIIRIMAISFGFIRRAVKSLFYNT